MMVDYRGEENTKQADRIKWGWLNVGGIKGSLEEIVQFMSEYHFNSLVLGGTWLRPGDTFRHPSIVFDLRAENSNPARGMGVYTVMVVRNAISTKFCEFRELYKDDINRSCILFNFRGIVLGAYYLPPNMDFSTCIECIQIAPDIRKRVGDEAPVFLVGDLNIRLGNLTGNLTANFRSNIMYTFNGLEYSWIKPESGKRTLETQRGRSIVDYIMADPNAKRLVCRVKVWDDAMVAGSDHRILSCVTRVQRRALPGVLTQFGIRNWYKWAIKRIRRHDLASKDARETADHEFRKDCAEVIGEVEEILLPLLHPDNGFKYREYQTMFDEIFTSIERYISRNLKAVGVRRCIHKQIPLNRSGTRSSRYLRGRGANYGGWLVRIDGNRRK